MIFTGEAITVERFDQGLAQLSFDLKGESVNKFSSKVIDELGQALTAIESAEGVQGLLIRSNKSVFIVGADITEFLPVFNEDPDTISEHIKRNAVNFNRIEDLPFPTVVAINGHAMGGGLEICLACDFRIMSSTAKIGLPETKLGLLPGWGGTVRLPRLVGVDTAVEWIAGGTENNADSALKACVVDGVVEPDQLQASAVDLLTRAAEGRMPYLKRREQKQGTIKHNDMEGLLAFESSKMFVKAKAGYHYPAPVAAIQAMQDGARLTRDDAQDVERKAFVVLAKTSAAKNLVGLFLNDQLLSKKAKKWASKAEQPIIKAAVVGAGIMGGGIAYQSALKGTPIILKDVAQAGIDLGLAEASKLLSTRVDRGRMTPAKMAETLNRIDPTLTFDGFDSVDLVVEAVVENAKVKKSVLEALELEVGDATIICSNTSTISIDELASKLQRPENFCGMHFFNPVHKMPLVEVIRGEHTSPEAVAATVAYANSLGKKAVVVNNCPGFLVNRILFPYFAGFTMLVRDGADFQKIDKVMQRWGWPMGPAHLLDVVGLDTAVHAAAVMSEGFPDRLKTIYKAATDVLYEAGRLGQKTKQGFYDYALDKKGKLQKAPSQVVVELLQNHVEKPRDFSEDEIVARMMIPMAIEMARCIEEGVVESAAEADMALIYGIGFPPFRGGIFRWLDEVGLKAVIAMAEAHQDLGPLYHVTAHIKQMSADGKTYYDAPGE